MDGSKLTITEAAASELRAMLAIPENAGKLIRIVIAGFG